MTEDRSSKAVPPMPAFAEFYRALNSGRDPCTFLNDFAATITAESGRLPGAPMRPMCIEHPGRTCAPAVQPPMDAPWEVCAVERQYRDRQASGRARSIR